MKGRDSQAHGFGRRVTAVIAALSARIVHSAMPVAFTATILLLLPVLVWPQTAAAPVSYPEVVPGYTMEFPRDEGSHPQYRTEWWYVTGWLQDESGAPLGFQVTFFRSRPGVDEANPSRFAAKQMLFAHAAVSDPRVGKLLRDERAARAGFGLAVAHEGALDVSIDDWSLRKDSGNEAVYRAQVSAEGFALQLDLRATQQPLLQGQQGFSQKGPDALSSSYYYSLPQLRASGQVAIGKQRYTVHGIAWMDHEWSSSIMDAQAQGWDWLGANLDDGGAVMAFRMRTANGERHWAAATWSSAAGRQTFAPAQVEWSALRRWRSPRTGIDYPVEWRVRIGERTIRLRPLMDDQENDASDSTGTIYWEGAVQMLDERDRALGRGYLELTGYGKRVRL